MSCLRGLAGWFRWAGCNFQSGWSYLGWFALVEGSTGKEGFRIIESIDEKVGKKYGLGFEVCRGGFAGDAGGAGFCADGAWNAWP